MTMMVLFLDFPDPEVVTTGDELSDYYLTKGSGSGVFNFLITFLLVAVYWFKHLERFQYYKSTDQNHLYIEIIFLALLVPIANSLSVLYPNFIHIQAFYSLICLD